MIAQRIRYWARENETAVGVTLLIVALAVIGFTGVSATLFYNFYTEVKRTLPDAAKIKELELSLPSQVLAADGKIIGELFSERRYPVRIEEINTQIRDAFIAAEDANFYSHSGIDYNGFFRAVGHYVFGTGSKQGGSTITQQLAKNLLLTREKTLSRKLKDMLLAMEIEKLLTKNEILELYLNSIFLGNNSYGVEAAARNYFGKSARDLSLAQAAMIAGLSPAPSAYAPITNMAAAKHRQKYVLGQMVRWGMIKPEQAAAALQEEIVVTRAASVNNRIAPYFFADIKKKLAEHIDLNKLETGGYTIHTTLNSELQIRANEILKNYVAKFADKKGFKGPISRNGDDFAAALERVLREPKPDDPSDAVKAIVVDLDPGLDTALIFSQFGPGLLLAEDHKWALSVGKFKSNQILDFANILKVGDEIHVRQFKRNSPKRIVDSLKRGNPFANYADKLRDAGIASRIYFYELTDVEQIEGALILTEAETGAIRVLVGGSDFSQSQFNRVTQAKRQMGSSVKPLYYALAFDQGFGLASKVDSPPIVIGDWKPENYTRNLLGRKTLRSSLVQSFNLPSIQLFQALGITQAAAHVRKLGIQFPDRDLSAALGSGSASLLEVTQAFSPFVRAGEIKESYFIERVEDRNGKIVFDSHNRELLPAPLDLLDSKNDRQKVGYAPPQSQGSDQYQAREVTGKNRSQVISPEAAYLSFSGMESAVLFGTATNARISGVRVSGKTGTTNGYTDAWFIGMVPGLVCGTWIGFDDAKKSLGTGATGGAYAAPLWREFMLEALKVFAPGEIIMPEDMSTARMDPETGNPVVGDKAGIEIPVVNGFEPGSPSLRHAIGTYSGEASDSPASETRNQPEESEGSTPNLRSLF
jgi:penicillin-binding protein 1A